MLLITEANRWGDEDFPILEGWSHLLKESRPEILVICVNYGCLYPKDHPPKEIRVFSGGSTFLRAFTRAKSPPPGVQSFGRSEGSYALKISKKILGFWIYGIKIGSFALNSIKNRWFRIYNGIKFGSLVYRIKIKKPRCKILVHPSKRVENVSAKPWGIIFRLKFCSSSAILSPICEIARSQVSVPCCITRRD